MEIIGPSSALPKLRSGGKRICVTGQISDYRGKPEIVLTDPSQLAQ
jgi:DNA/RNA endonuclease YhcR with UshA esterase domain